MDEKVKAVGDVSKMTFEERYHHVQAQHRERQRVKETPHELRAKERKHA